MDPLESDADEIVNSQSDTESDEENANTSDMEPAEDTKEGDNLPTHADSEEIAVAAGAQEVENIELLGDATFPTPEVE